MDRVNLTALLALGLSSLPGSRVLVEVDGVVLSRTAIWVSKSAEMSVSYLPM